MAAAVSSSTGIEHHLRSREELAEQVALLRLEHAAVAARAWRELGTTTQESLSERYERVTGRPLAVACPPRCSCRGVPDGELLSVG